MNAIYVLTTARDDALKVLKKQKIIAAYLKGFSK